MRDDRLKLQDILSAIERIEAKMELEEIPFKKNEMLQVWTIYHLQIIGEAAANLSEKIKLMDPNIPWQDIIDMRNYLIHHYHKINYNIVWDTVKFDLTDLKIRVKQILEKLK